MLVGGIYLAANPRMHVHGVARLLPPARRVTVLRAMHDTGNALRLWLIGQGVVMLSMGLMMWAAYAWLGQTYLTEAFSGWTEFGADVVDRAEEFGRRAVALSPELAEGYQLLASAELVRGRYDRAVALSKRAVEINPSDANGYATLGLALMWGGDAQGAIAALERARLFDPTLPWDSVQPLGFAYYFADRYSDAIDTLEPIAKTAGDYGIYAFLAASYAQLGRANEASQAKAEVKRLWPFFDISVFVGQWKDVKSRDSIAEGLRKAGL